MSSRTFRSVQDKLARIVHRIVSQPHRHAFIQIGRSTPIPFSTTDVTRPETTRTAASRIKRWAFQNNRSGRTEQEIEQFRLGRQKRVQAGVAAYREQLCAGASDAEFEEVDGKHQAKLTKLPRRSRRQTSEIETRQDPNENEKNDGGKFLLHDEVRVEHSDNHRKRTLPIRPDACFILENAETGRESLFFVEIDEGTESACTRWQEKVRAYCAYWGKGLFEKKVENFSGKGFRGLTITRSQRGKESEKRKKNLLKATFLAGGRGQFWFATLLEAVRDSLGHAVDPHLHPFEIVLIDA